MNISALGLIGALALLVCGCGRQAATGLSYIVPYGIRGELRIALHSKGGMDSERGDMVLDFTNSDTLAVSAADPLRNWRHQSARFKSGGEIPIFDTANAPEKKGILLEHYVLPYDDTQYSYIYVGSYSEILDWRRSLSDKRLSGDLK
jgi:hypothetical protein